MPRKPNVDVMGDACEKIGLKLTYPQKQMLCNMAIDVVAERIESMGFRPKKPIGYLRKLILSMTSSLLPDEDDREHDKEKAGQRRGEIKQKKDKGLTRLNFRRT